MDSAIIPLIHTYQRHVAEAIALFRTNLGVRGHLLRAWRRSLLPPDSTDTEDGHAIPQRGVLDADRNITYSFHGIGCRLEFGGHTVDFDFGPDQRFDGFDAWRLHLLAESLPEFHHFSDVDIAQQHLSQLETNGRITKLDSTFGCHLYFFTNPDDSSA
ncbi:hypothetical protein SAMN06265222_1011164 [Neorhodopirellula lusitana]|uniref:DUF6896 domain-containing protein n=1 Tax=Neorhodopirellula lusitana TaxID=445327 RepID=A0ABY1PWN3_9BACT|nr:hypothetical protein [Neorhodopirellula lusitana]SMP44610.1 hypothetical protein SAMN06265222_1011164 [Neorhodopirellula lusitana]